MTAATLNFGIITDSLSPAAGGFFESVRLPANKLARAGARVTVYGVRDTQFEASRAAWDGPQVEIFSHIGPKQLALSPALLRRLLAADHQLLHLHGIWQFPSYVTDRWRRHTGRPTIVSPRGMLDPWAVKTSVLKKRVVRWLYEDRNLHGATALHALNAREADAMRAFGLRNPIAIIPNGVDMPDRTVSASVPVSVSVSPPQFMADDPRKVLLFLGRLHPKKGLAELIAAWHRVHALAPGVAAQWRIVIAGWDDGGLGETLQASVAANDFGRHVTFVGALQGQAKAAALAHASAFVLPSHSEGMPMAVLEAWANRLPVFMTQACNLPAAFTAGAAIEISTAPEDMAATLAGTLDQSDTLARVAQAGFMLVGQRYTWDQVVADMRRLYAWAQTGGDRPEFMV